MSTPTPSPRFVRDQAGKKASVRKARSADAEHVATANGYDFYVEARSGRYYAVALPAYATEVPAEAVSPAPVKDNRKLAAARSKLEAASAALNEVLDAERKARAARASAMAAMYDAGASYAQVGEVVGMTAMSARAAIIATRS